MSNYGPRLTNKMKRTLEAEIKAFNKIKALRELEVNSLNGKDVNAHQDYIEKQGFETEVSNPDLVSEDNAFQWGRATTLSADEEIKRAQIQRLLTNKQWEVWKLCMQQALTQEEVARRLKVSQSAIAQRLEKAIQIVTEYFQRVR